jgi:hypothetical protein
MHRVRVWMVAALFIALLSPSLTWAGGSHFLVEPYTGITFNQGFDLEDAVALESGVLLGVGGKLKGFPPRFFLYFRVSHTMFGDDAVYVSDRNANGTVNRSYTRLAGGLRVVIPIVWKLRLNLEAGGGTMLATNSYSEAGMSEVSYDEDLTVFEAGIGLNLRLFEWLSVGLMYDYSYVTQNENCDFIASFLGERNDGAELAWSHLNFTLGLHF